MSPIYPIDAVSLEGRGALNYSIMKINYKTTIKRVVVEQKVETPESVTISIDDLKNLHLIVGRVIPNSILDAFPRKSREEVNRICCDLYNRSEQLILEISKNKS